MNDPLDLRAAAAGAYEVLERHWQPDVGYCPPNPAVYPNQWAWDSGFHSIAWAGHDPQRGMTEMRSLFTGQLSDGFLPHMRYAAPTDVNRGPLTDRSSFVQPPVFGIALARLAEAGLRDAELEERGAAALRWLFTERNVDGLVMVVHPWETGCDDSPRWDSYAGVDRWDYDALVALDRATVIAARYSPVGAAVASSLLEVRSAGFNAICARSAIELGLLSGDTDLVAQGQQLAAEIDDQMWSTDDRCWVDLGNVDTPAARVPTLDSLLPMMVTPHHDRRGQITGRLLDPDEYSAPFGSRFLPKHHRLYRPDIYWRGVSWPSLDYLLWSSLSQVHPEAADDLARRVVRGAVASGYAEYWNPENATSMGASPQTWTAAVGPMAESLHHRADDGDV